MYKNNSGLIPKTKGLYLTEKLVPEVSLLLLYLTIVCHFKKLKIKHYKKSNNGRNRN